MKISNFREYKVIGKYDFKYFASIDVTTGFCRWRKTATSLIHRSFSGTWHFVDTGKFTPPIVDELERAYVSQQLYIQLKHIEKKI